MRYIYISVLLGMAALSSAMIDFEARTRWGNANPESGNFELSMYDYDVQGSPVKQGGIGWNNGLEHDYSLEYLNGVLTMIVGGNTVVHDYGAPFGWGSLQVDVIGHPSRGSLMMKNIRLNGHGYSDLYSADHTTSHVIMLDDPNNWMLTATLVPTWTQQPAQERLRTRVYGLHPVPEPATIAALAVGALAIWRRKITR